ncbi:MAG: DUF116 domain-containing protein [Syntrophomonadaceae bacterium]|nr:DUF116 domain-containing protein [Syntrophomonadaceae bacterium]
MKTRKRLYVGLLMASLLLVAGIITSGWYLLAHRDVLMNRIIIISALVVAAALLLLIGGGILAIVLSIVRCKPIPSLDGAIRMANEVLFPIALFLGRILGISKERIWRSFIAVNNSLVKARKALSPASQVLILIPHCLQDSECPHKITVDVNNCKKCGKCSIKDLIEMADRHNAILKVATGGTLARKYITEVKPQGVVAVACERDLSAGIQDSGVVPVLGVLNSRPNGPCLNTEVSVEEVEKAVNLIIKGG